MTTKRIKTTMALLLAALSVGAAGQVAHPPAADAAIKSHPTGDAELDTFCSELGGLVDSALANEKTARAAGNTALADAWHEYANRMLAGGRSRGCDWYSARISRIGVTTQRVFVTLG